ncbi:hypothetical protein ACQP2T_15435 [Nonomuraea sp. CA-143628]
MKLPHTSAQPANLEKVTAQAFGTVLGGSGAALPVLVVLAERL